MDVKLLSCVSLVALFCAQANSNLLFTEYVEGSGNNKAIEVSNLSDDDIDLSAGSYSIRLYANGRPLADGPTNTQNLSGILASGSSIVFVNSSSVEELRMLGDSSNITFFNGDDALGLFMGETLVDRIGQIGLDPGSKWQTGDVTTQNQSLRRFDTSVDSNNNLSFDPSLKWQAFAIDSFAGLGCSGIDICEGGIDPDPGLEIGACYEPATLIHDIQGSGSESPFTGQQHIVEAVVTASLQGDSQLSGFFIQEDDAQQDSDTMTSEGLFVYDTQYSVEVGDHVRVVGTVAEYYGNTQLSDVSALSICGENTSFTAQAITLPFSSTDLSYLDGMYVVLPQSLHLTLDYNFNRYGTASLSNGKRYTPTEVHTPNSAEAINLGLENSLNVIGIDDGSTAQNPELIAFYPEFEMAIPLRSGAIIANVEGPLQLSFGEYRIQVTQALNVIEGNQRPDAPSSELDSALSVASFNVLNYFSDIDTGGTSFRGADSELELERQKAKLVSALIELNADIVGLMEIQNNGFGPNSAILRLLDALNSQLDAQQHYTFIGPDDLGLIGDDAIAVGMIYRPSRVSKDGSAQLLTTPPFDPDTAKHRVPLGQRFVSSSGETITVVVNHFKSKGSSCESIGDPNNNDGQGNCNGQRVLAAQTLSQAYAGQENVLFIGDFNAYSSEDPIQSFAQAGYLSLAKQLDAQSYSYYFDELAGSLDHALASSDLQARVVNAHVWNSNSDEPRAFDYNTEFKSELQQQIYYDTSAYRASDHDAVVVYLNMESAGSIEFSPSFDIQEGETNHITVNRSQGSYGRVELAYSIEGQSADAQDIRLDVGTLVWENGDNSSQQIAISTFADHIIEGLEQAQIVFQVVEGSPELTIDSIQINIHDVVMEPSLSLEQAEYRVDESQGLIAIPVNLINGSAKSASVFALVLPRSASWRDYKARFFQRLKWTGGDTQTKYINIKINDDRRSEGDEHFKVMLLWSKGAQIGEISHSIVHIIDND
ncbi:ExeM/NucH family extracellular endonuclease [Alginatibacterium sediminis]|uniref:ExeM/NucH family extracellular endonuclease n=1 Tax=Alginatibacterium sediminis TaxID=2164068 RepID=A0A420EHN7_9ALTE|nr:ExeM/NucH family extracellular endonuclease [Alginatibacterium sediminis]RKF20193.1 ExeM/NucH family extracellular endonuclease [Alginatibacterium sediminis]